MFNSEIRRLIIGVVSSWQVLAVTVILVIYVFIVNYVARVYHRPRRSSRLTLPKAKTETSETAAGTRAGQDELGLEEEPPAKR